MAEKQPKGLDSKPCNSNNLQSMGQDCSSPDSPAGSHYFYGFSAVNPIDGKPHTVYVSHDRARWVATRGKYAILEMRDTVAHALSNPKAIFEGIRWEQDSGPNGAPDDWLCYSSRPPTRHYDNGARAPAHDRVFLVFVNFAKVAYAWRWEPCDPYDDNCPIGHQGGRFDKRVL